MDPDDGYNGAKAQAQRDAIRPPGLTLGEVLDVFGAFAQDFENFEYSENSEYLDNPEVSEKVAESEVVGVDNPASFLSETCSCSDESESSSEGSTSSLDEMALVYAELEDIESELDESALSRTASQVDVAAPAMDETDSLSKVSASSSQTSLSPPARPIKFSAASSEIFSDPISFIVHTRIDGTITCIETENYQLRYQYRIDLKPKQVLEPESLRFFIEVIKREQVISSALLKFLTIIADVHSMANRTSPNAKITWLPTLLRNGISEAVHEATLRYLGKWLPKAGFADLKKDDKFIPEIRQLLEEFYDVTRRINAPEARLILYMNNIALLPDVLSLAGPADILLFFYLKAIKLRASRALMANLEFLTAIAAHTDTLRAED